jgi:3'-5' exoribonuclease
MASASSPQIDETPAVATLRERQEVEGLYACTRAERRVSRTGAPYLNVELEDGTGTIPTPPDPRL